MKAAEQLILRRPAQTHPYKSGPGNCDVSGTLTSKEKSETNPSRKIALRNTFSVTPNFGQHWITQNAKGAWRQAS
jgi:hypothetical protein